MLMLEIFTKSKINTEIGAKPSVYVRELFMSHEERQHFLNLNNDCIKLFPNKISKEAMEKWDVKPRIIFFSKWTLGEEYETFFTVRNRYKTSKLLKLSLKDSPVFELEKLVNFNRLGSMVTFGYKVRFRPKEYIDYHDTIKLEAENGSHEIYVLAVAPRPMIDFPDEIDFGNVLVNFDNSKEIRLENISPIVAEASLETLGIFSVDNNKIIMNPNETMILKIYLNEKRKKTIRDKLLIHFQTGEKLYINLSAKCYPGAIYFETTPVIEIGEVYVGLCTTETITLINDTDELLSYTWMNNRKASIDDLESHVSGYMLRNKLKMMKVKKGGLKYYNMITDATHENISDHFIDEELDSKPTLYFNDQNFFIQPIEGQINPKSKQSFVITFKPKTVDQIKKKAYLEIEGLKERLRLKLSGSGIGPDIVLNVNTIDFDQIFICSQHTYIISAKNIGLVKGTIKYVSETKLSFGETINCTPLRLELLPNEVKVFEMSLSSTVSGSFVEDVWFVIEESQKRVRCIVKGHIINPRLILNKKVINFGPVSLGFKYSSSFTITNESPIPVEYKIEVVGNGFLPAIEVSADFENNLPIYPQEFTIEPESNHILPSHSQTVEVSLVSNTIRDHSTILKIYLWEVLVEECSLTLKYTSVTPIITCKPSEILLRYAFIDYDYTRQITLINSHNLPTYYVILHQDETNVHMLDSPGLLYSLDEYTGFLGPNSSKVIQIEIRVLSLKPATETLQLKVFGLFHEINFCKIIVYGMGPVVNPSTFTMSYGTIPVLKRIDKTFVLTNVSPIHAFFKILVDKYPFLWEISCSEGSIAPESEFEIIITAMLKDSGILEDHLIVEIIGSREITVSLSAQGYGTSIVTVPNLFPVYDIGKVFRKEKHNDVITVTNAGTRHHTIMFTTMKEIKNLTKAKADQEQGTYFKLIPYKLDLEGGETQEMHLLYEWDKIEVLEDTYYCYAIIERRGKRVTLGSATIRASFTDTELTFEPTSLHFRVDVPKFSTPVLPQYKTLTVSSQWSHTLFLHCEVKRPFAFKSTKVNRPITHNEFDILYLKLEPEQSQTLEVKFDPLYISNRYSRVCYAELIVTFKDHKVKACVPLRGEVNFPNLQLSTHEINFGCVRPHTENTIYAVLTNNTPLVIEYEWCWAQQRLFELKPYAVSEPTISAFEIEQETELSEEKSYCCYDEEEFSEFLEAEEVEEEGTRERVKAEISEKQTSEDIAPTDASETLVLYQSLSQTASSSCLSLSDIKTMSSSKDTDEVNSDSKENVKDDNKHELIAGLMDCKTTEIKGKRKNDCSYFIDKINEFGINEILRRIPSTAQKAIISKVIDIIPPKGELKPHDTQQVTFVFNPTKLMKILGKALLIVSGGPEETVTFKGSCYHAVYELIPPQINFGFGPFCELWCSSIFLRNKGLKDLQVSVNIPELDRSMEQTEVIFLLPGKSGTSPIITFLPSCEVAAYKIALFPGRIGEISKEFTIQIDDMEPITVSIKGYALPHQVHIALPRTIEPFLYENMYLVIASLTSNWFSLSDKAQSKIDTVKLSVASSSASALPQKTEAWELVPNDEVSHISTDDINMAYERLMCEALSVRYNGSIPHATSILGMHYLVGFEMPPYKLDFGSVITNTRAQCMIVYSNYCPIEAVIKINFPENSEDLLEKYGVVLKPVCSHVLQPFETKQLSILLKPPHNAIPHDEIEENIKFSFNFKVSCGPTIPVNVTASITKPYLCSPNNFDFGYVKIGYKRYMKFIVSNINNVDCEWFAFIRPVRTYRFCSPDLKEKGCPFSVQPVYGYTEPKSRFIVTIAFEPTDEALYDVVLQFIINMNPQSVSIRLKGCGLKPHLIADKITFGYSIPFSMPLRERLTIRNPCLFPVQAYVLATPKDYPREQDLFNILLHYYRKDKMCVPSTYYKNKPTNKIYMMFRRLVKKAIRKYLKDVLEFLEILMTESSKIWKQYSPKVKPTSPKIQLPTSQTKVKRGEKNQAKTAKGKKTIKERAKSEKPTDMLAFISSIIEDNFVVKPLKQVINDYIKYVSLMNIPPSNLTLSEKAPVQVESPYIECGDLIFVYGSPKSDAGKFSWRIGHFWDVSVVSLDYEIMSDLLETNSDENKHVKDLIMEYFLKRFEDGEENEYDCDSLEGLENIILFVSQYYFLEYRGLHGAVVESPKSKTTLFRKRGDSIREPVTLLNIPWKYFEQIIVRRLYSKAKNGLVFESISSNFFLDPVSTLTVLLNVFQASRMYVICLCDEADRSENGIDENMPDEKVLQAFSDLQYMDFLSLPKSVREKMKVELKKANKRHLSDDDDDSSDIIETKKEMRQKRTRYTKAQKGSPKSSNSDLELEKKSSKKRMTTLEKKIELPEKRKRSSKTKTIRLSDHTMSSLPIIPVNEYLENLKKIQSFIESSRNEASSKTFFNHSAFRLRLEELTNEIMKRKAKLRNKDVPFDFWIFCSHHPFRDYQFENYLPLVQSWKRVSPEVDTETSAIQSQLSNHNYFVIKKKIEKMYFKSDWENQCKLFKVVNVAENIQHSEPVIAYSNISRSKIPTQSKAEVKVKESEILKSSNVEILENLLKDMEVTYRKEMDQRLKMLSSKFKSGIKIKPGGSKQYDVLFHPTGCSTYEQDIHIRIGGCDEIKKISVFASCDIPDIMFDPCIVFKHITMAENIIDVTNPGYLIKKKIFHFGTALVGHEEDGRSFQVKCFLKLKNNSAIDAKLSVGIIEEKMESLRSGDEEFMSDKTDLEVVKQFLKKNKIMEGQNRILNALSAIKDPKSDKDKASLIDFTYNKNLDILNSSSVFAFESAEINIEAGQEKEFAISACPPLEGLYSCRYLFSIENNPKVHTLKAFCSGIAPKVVFSPTELSFEEVIIYRQVSQPFSMENKCPLPLMWKMANAESIHPKISLSSTHGNLLPETFEVVYITYHPTEVQDIREQLIIHIYDKKVEGKHLLEHKYSLHLKSYDIFTEVYFEKSSGNSLNLNGVIVFQNIVEEFAIRNRGRNDVLVRIILNKDCSYLNKQIEVSLKDIFALLTPQMFFQSEIYITCLEEVKLEEEPIIILEIVDFITLEAVAKIPLYISLQSYFSRFTISPSHSLDFGNLMVGELKQIEIVLINCGFIDFKFKFIPESQCYSEEKMFLMGLHPNFDKTTGRQLKNKLITTAKESKDLELDQIFKKYLNNIIFMNKFMKLKYRENLKKNEKHKNRIKYLLKILCKRQFKQKFHLTRSRVKRSKNEINYYDLVHIKTLKNLWNSLNFDELAAVASTKNKVRRTNEEELESAFGKNKKLKCYIPPFRIVPAYGKLSPGQEATIKVHCNPMFRSTFLETVNLFVTNALPEVRSGFPIHLSVESSIPKVNFKDYNSIFREIDVVDRCSEHATNNSQGEPYVVFCIQEHSLHFYNTVVGTNHSVTAYLHSENQLDAAIIVTLSYLGDDCDIPPFSINEKDSCVVFIKPYGYSSFNIIFSPKDLEEYKVNITMSLEVPIISKDSKDKGWFSSITVMGRGYYPSIIMKLIGTADEECEIIDYGMVLVNFSDKRMICLENTGNVVAQVILEVLNNKDIFLIGEFQESEEHIEVWNADTFMTTKVSIPPKKKCIFELLFKPKELLTYSSRINVHVLFNPFEALVISVYGAGYIGDLVIEGLKFTQGEPLSFGGPVSAEYFLDFGYCVASKKYTKEFTLRSYCANVIRFKFETFERIAFIPSCGHIFPGSKKSILSLLQVSDCIEIDENIECYYQEIIYKQNVQLEDWDNTQKSVKWTKVKGESLSKNNFDKAQILKIERSSEEPEFNYIKEEVCIRITLSAVIDVPKLTVITELLEFPPVFVSQSAVGEVMIQNTKNCEVSYTTVISDEIIETPESVPQVTDFSYGKFDYNLMELPVPAKSRGYSFEKHSSISANTMNIKTNREKKIWADLRKKHTQSLYGKSVNIIMPNKIVEKEEEKDPDSKSLKKNYRLKSAKSKSLLEVKKRGTIKKTFSGVISVKKEPKPSEGNKTSNLTIPVIKSIIKLGNKKIDMFEYTFSDLVKIGKTHIFLPAEQPTEQQNTAPVPAPCKMESSSQCFSMDVISGTLRPNEILRCFVKFTPKHIKRYKADLRFYNTETGEHTCLLLQGVGILPLCHVEIYDDDYLTVNNPIISHIPTNTRVIIIQSIFKELNLKKSFKVYNIAEIPYHFKWNLIKNSNSSGKGIKCSTIEGEIPPREFYEMEFSFFPMDYGVYESLWLLKIREFFLEQHVLIVVKVRRPSVTFERKFMICEPTVKGFKKMMTVKLINNEDFPFDFTINEDSLYSGPRNDKCLDINPMLGVIAPNSEELLKIQFTQLCESDLTFYIRASVHTDTHHLRYEISPLRILCKCYCVVPKVSCSKEDGTKIDLFHTDVKSDNIITIGKLPLRIPYTLKFNISNAGEYPMYFETFVVSDTYPSPAISISVVEKSGVIHPSNTNTFNVKVTANKKVDFEESLVIKICKGPDFSVKITGTAAEPSYEFSLKSINFGICMIDEKNVDKYHKILEFSNLDTESILLEKLERIEGFIVDFSSLIIEPRAVHKIVIIFHPQLCKKYSGKLNFLVDGVYKHEIELMGEGETLKLALYERESIIVNFGLLKAKEVSYKEIPIVNNSRVPVDIFLKMSEQKKDDLHPLMVDIFENKLHLLPDEVRVIKVSVYAEKRIHNFTFNIMYEGYGIEESLFVVKGTVIGYKFELDQKSILFESGTIGFVNTKQVALINSGDVGSRFRLQTRFVSDVFALKPMEGYSPPGSRTIIEINFMANFITKYQNNTVLFLIENYDPLTLSITGVGAKLPSPTEVIKLRTNVRNKTHGYIDMVNRTYEDMTVYPVVTGEYFSTEEFIKIPANSRIDCKVVYYPHTMTINQYHMGHFFCGFPNGELIFIQLLGEAKPPLMQEVNWECKARKLFLGKIPVKNWTNSTENFKVEIKFVTLTIPSFYNMSSHDIISVPAKETRNCLINLLCYKKTVMNFKVILTNINSKEYLHYKVSVTFAAPEVQTIKITTPVHEPAIHKLCLTNPMDRITLFNFKSPHPNIEPLRKTIQVRPLRRKYLSLKYTPTHSGTSEVLITIRNYLLGKTVYKLELLALKVGAEKVIEVQASIGTTKSCSIPVRNPYQKVIAFLFESDSNDLFMNKPSFFVGPGKKIMVDVKYEPTFVGNQIINVVLHTNGYGDFKYCVKGLCTPPEPLGPLVVYDGYHYELEFRNVFFYNVDFFFKTNNDHFKIKPEKLKLHAKQTGSVFISLKDISDNTEEFDLVKNIPQAGKLTVSCVVDGIPTEWIYYLKAAE